MLANGSDWSSLSRTTLQVCGPSGRRGCSFIGSSLFGEVSSRVNKSARRVADVKDQQFVVGDAIEDDVGISEDRQAARPSLIHDGLISGNDASASMLDLIVVSTFSAPGVLRSFK